MNRSSNICMFLAVHFNCFNLCSLPWTSIYRCRRIRTVPPHHAIVIIHLVMCVSLLLSHFSSRKGFAVSALASNWERLGKPFNPLLGETYEYQNSEFRILCEQVRFAFIRLFSLVVAKSMGTV